MLTIGSLRHRINIQQLSEATSDGQGGYVAAWTTIHTVWAKIESDTGAEKLMAQKIEANYDHKIFIRNIAGLDEKMRIEFQGRYFHIKSVKREDERRWWIEILAKEGMPS